MTTVLSDVRDKYCYKSKYKRICPSQGDRDYLRKSNGSWDLKCKYDNTAKKNRRRGSISSRVNSIFKDPVARETRLHFRNLKNAKTRQGESK